MPGTWTKVVSICSSRRTVAYRSVGVGPTKDQRLAPAGPITVLINALLGGSRF